MSGQLSDNLASLQLPDDDLRVLAGAGDKPIAFTDVDVRDVVEVAVQRRLQGQRLTVPDFDHSTR